MENKIILDELIYTSSFDREKERLKISQDIISFEKKEFELRKTVELKYGVAPIQVDMFTIGRKYIIELKNPEKRFAITFRSYFGISNNYFSDLYTKIINGIWNMTGLRIVHEAIQKLKSGETFKVGDYSISQNGILIKNVLVSWDNLSYQKNYDRLTLNHKTNHKVWTNVYYLETYNFDVIIGILDWIYKHEGLQELEGCSNNTL
jgi:hypothetical protein